MWPFRSSKVRQLEDLLNQYERIVEDKDRFQDLMLENSQKLIKASIAMREQGDKMSAALRTLAATKILTNAQRQEALALAETEVFKPLNLGTFFTADEEWEI